MYGVPCWRKPPNVLPLDHFNPHSLVLVCTKTTEKIANRTKKMMASDYPGMDVDLLCLNNAYEFQGICKELCAYLKKFEGSEVKFIFNLTGGTKMMSLAAFELAKQSSSRAIYFQSEENKNLIHNFHFDDGTLVIDDVELIDTYITLDQFLRLYLGEYNTRKQDERMF